MQIRQIILESPAADRADLVRLQAIQPQLLLVFADVDYFADGSLFDALRQACPDAQLAGCSAAGEIAHDAVYEGSAIVTAIRFDGSVQVKIAEAAVEHMEDSEKAGREIGALLKAGDLQTLLLFGKGVEINGSALIEGVVAEVGATVPITGGLGGDKGTFTQTYILTCRGISSTGALGVGIYGEGLQVGHGSYGGWRSFGPVRKVTRSSGNVLYELDGEPALDIYRSYLGDYAKELPASGLLFPFEMLNEDHTAAGLIRTILGIDEEQGALTLAGDIDPDGYLRLMHASTDALVDGAEEAAQRTVASIDSTPGDGLAILVSCVGRKLVMGDRVEEEVEAVLDTLGGKATVTGFYSYGEISPFSTSTDCKLHNQTMTVTFIGEK